MDQSLDQSDLQILNSNLSVLSKQRHSVTSLQPLSPLVLPTPTHRRLSFDISLKGVRTCLFRPKVMKCGPIQTITTRVNPKPPQFHRSNTISVPKEIKKRPLPIEMPVLPLNPVPEKKVGIIYPVCRFFRIESSDLVESDSEELTPSHKNVVKTRKKPKKCSFIQKISGAKVSEPVDLLQKYFQETAEMLGDTKTQVKRRCEGMKIPGRLMKNCRASSLYYHG